MPKYTITFDTNALFDRRNRWQLTQAAFLALRDLETAGVVCLVLTDVVIKEATSRVIPRIALKIIECHEIHASVFGVDRLTVEQITNELLTQFNLLCERAQIVRTGDIQAKRVLELYWAQSPPFGKGKKGKEFPDAFALIALQDLARGGREVHVVSADGDWKKACSGSLKHYERLEDLLIHIQHESGEALESSLVASALRVALPDAQEDIERQVFAGADVRIYDGLHPISEDDLYIDQHSQLIRILDCRLFNLGPKRDDESRQFSAVVELELGLRLNCEVPNPDAVDSPSATPRLQIAKFVKLSRSFHVHGAFDPVDASVIFSDIFLDDELHLALKLEYQGRWKLTELSDEHTE